MASSMTTLLGSPAPSLSVMLGRLARDYGASVAESDLLLSVLAPLLNHDAASYHHCLRTGALAARLAAETRCADPLLALFGGTWHDIGKLDVPTSVLWAMDFGEAEMSVVRRHALTGFRRTAAVHPAAAVVVGLHHAFQSRPYGLSLKGRWGEGLVAAARAVALADFYDALLTRLDNGRYTASERCNPVAVMSREFPEHVDLIECLVPLRVRDVA